MYLILRWRGLLQAEVRRLDNTIRKLWACDTDVKNMCNNFDPVRRHHPLFWRVRKVTLMTLVAPVPI